MPFGAVDTVVAPVMSSTSAAIPANNPIPAAAKTSKAQSTPGSSRFSVRSKISTRAHRYSYGNYIVDRTIGEGEFGKVKLAWVMGENGSKKYYALKLIRNEKFRDVDDSQKTKVYREMNSLKLCNHPNIIKLRNLLRADDGVCIVLDYASGGDMFHYIYKNGRLDERSSQRYFAQLVSGVSYLHWKGLVHRDLKLENLLLDSNNNILISDFGFANSFRSDNKIRLMKTSCGSPCYAAPEVVNSDQLYDGKKVDVWSVGIILFTFLAGYLPFDDDPNNPDSEDIQRLYRYIATTPLKFPDWIGKEARDLMRNILVVDPQFRAKMQDIINHQWLAAHRSFLSITAAEHEGNATWQQKLQKQHKPQNQSLQDQQNIYQSQLQSKIRPVSAMPAALPDRQKTYQNFQHPTTQVFDEYSLARSASVAATTSRQNSILTSRGINRGTANGTRHPVRSSSIQQAGKPFDSSYKRQSAYPVVSSTVEAIRNPATSAKDEVPELAISQPPQRLAQPTKPRPVSYHPQTSQSGSSFELLGGTSLYMPLAGQPHVQISCESSKTGEISHPSPLIVDSKRDNSSKNEHKHQSAIPVSQIPRSSSVRSQRGMSQEGSHTIKVVPQATGQQALQASQNHFKDQEHIKSQGGDIPKTPAFESSETSIFHDVQTPKRPELIPPTRRSSVRSSSPHKNYLGSAHTNTRRMSFQPASGPPQSLVNSSPNTTTDVSPSLDTVSENSASSSIPSDHTSVPPSRSRFRLSAALFQLKPSQKSSSNAHNNRNSFSVSQNSRSNVAASAAIAASRYQPAQHSGIPVLTDRKVGSTVTSQNATMDEPGKLAKPKESTSFKTRTMNFFKRRSMIG